MSETEKNPELGTWRETWEEKKKVWREKEKEKIKEKYWRVRKKMKGFGFNLDLKIEKW